jgi:hypothetical protein
MLIPAKISPVISGAVLLIKNLLIHLVDWIFFGYIPGHTTDMNSMA